MAIDIARTGFLTMCHWWPARSRGDSREHLTLVLHDSRNMPCCLARSEHFGDTYLRIVEILVIATRKILPHILNATMAERKQDGEGNGGGGYEKANTHTSEMAVTRISTNIDQHMERVQEYDVTTSSMESGTSRPGKDSQEEGTLVVLPERHRCSNAFVRSETWSTNTSFQSPTWKTTTLCFVRIITNSRASQEPAGNCERRRSRPSPNLLRGADGRPQTRSSASQLDLAREAH